MIYRRRPLLFLGSLGWALAGCGGASGFQPGNHPALPQVDNLGGPVLDSPTLISVTYPGDELRDSLDAFTAAIFTSSYWSVVAEYGVKSAKAGAAVHWTTAAPSSIDDTQLQHDLPLQLAAGSFGTVPPQAIYVFYFPTGTQVTNTGQVGCSPNGGFGGYHSSVAMPNGSLVAYAVIPRCDGLNGLSGKDNATSAASHEILEAATDPYFENQKGAWAALDAANIGFALFPGTEIGDLCLLSNDNLFSPPDLPFLVQRIWSNHAAGQSLEPCLPADTSSPYFNSVPVLPDQITLNLGSGNFQAQGISIPVGGQKTIALQLFSDRPTSAWTLSKQSVAGATQVAVTFDKPSGVNGDTIQMTVSVSEPGNYLGMQKIEPFAIISTLNLSAQRVIQQAWPVVVTNP